MQGRSAVKKGVAKERNKGLKRDNVARLGEGARLAETEENHTNVSKGKHINAGCVPAATET